VKLCGFTDADCAGSPMDKKSTSGGIFSIESTTASWYSRKQRSVWMRMFLVGLFGSKHIRYHHIKDCVQRRIMLLSYIPTEDQDGDILMKALTRSKFEYH